MKHFERLAKPKMMKSIDTQTIDGYIAKRRLEDGKKPGSKISKATINKELCHLRAVLRKAHRWGYLKQVPVFGFVREEQKLVRCITAEHYAAIYQACHAATRPAGLPYPSADWWRALLMCS